MKTLYYGDLVKTNEGFYAVIKDIIKGQYSIHYVMTPSGNGKYYSGSGREAWWNKDELELIERGPGYRFSPSQTIK